MPTYTYACSSCGANFEQFQKFADDPIEVCPSCGGQVRRVIHPVGVVFKGSGWYINDSRGATTSSNAAPANPATESATPSETPAAPAATPAPAAPAAVE